MKPYEEIVDFQIYTTIYSKASCGGVPNYVPNKRHDDGDTNDNDASNGCDRSDIDGDSFDDGKDKSNGVCDDDASLNDGEDKTVGSDSDGDSGKGD
ncbi:unnamed protein product [Phytophthora lilii]|uniref:Unnamed protein product n=1 Tax=Phytophthora lilii TaxID=2077276 RepID=A0A9W6XFQ2_9STRA|nr:unnamed protein product [Phytophthora lilii]